jgi:flagellar biosynthesis/type III secretory pathway chaperone
MELNEAELRSRRALCSGEAAVTALIEVMSELSELMRAENALLERGMPAALSDMTDRKCRLADEYTDLLLVTNHRHGAAIAGDPELRNRLVEIARTLECLCRENMLRLEAAMAATRRRIDAVMAAIRRSGDDGQRYAANGATAAARLLSYRANYQA